MWCDMMIYCTGWDGRGYYMGWDMIINYTGRGYLSCFDLDYNYLNLSVVNEVYTRWYCSSFSFSSLLPISSRHSLSHYLSTSISLSLSGTHPFFLTHTLNLRLSPSLSLYFSLSLFLSYFFFLSVYVSVEIMKILDQKSSNDLWSRFN